MSARRPPGFFSTRPLVTCPGGRAVSSRGRQAGLCPPAVAAGPQSGRPVASGPHLPPGAAARGPCWALHGQRLKCVMVTQVSILRVSLQSGVHTQYRSFTFAQVQNESRCGNYTVLGNPRRVPQHGPWGGWPVGSGWHSTAPWP